MFPEVKIAKGARAQFYQCPRCRRFRSGGPWWCDECNGTVELGGGALSPARQAETCPPSRAVALEAARLTREISSLRRRLRKLKLELKSKPELGRSRQDVVEKLKIQSLEA